MPRSPLPRLALLLLSTCTALAGCGGTQGEGDLAPTRIYVTIVSHNELGTNKQPLCAEAAKQQDKYLANRAKLLEVAALVVARGAAWDFQSDYEFLTAVEKWDTTAVTSATGGKNLVRYLNELSPTHIQVDAHSHENIGGQYVELPRFNYADVAAFLVELGVPTSNVVGGFIANPASDENWTRFGAGVTSLVRSPGYRWAPTLLWGAGSANHVDDPQASGVWNPKSPSEFMVDDPAHQPLPNVGGYIKDSGDNDVLIGFEHRPESERLQHIADEA